MWERLNTKGYQSSVTGVGKVKYGRLIMTSEIAFNGYEGKKLSGQRTNSLVYDFMQQRINSKGPSWSLQRS